MIADMTERKGWMGLLARATPLALAARIGPRPVHDLLRAPEVGAVMVRGRAGGTGNAFNLGEMTVTRCAVRLTTGEVGHAYVQGRDKAHALDAALIDALMQGDQAVAVRARVLDPLAQAEADARRLRSEKAAATKVEFFTLVRGED